jgi:hypothetical protein
MQVQCEKCNAVIVPENLDLLRNLAKCDACGNVFNCAAQLNALGDDGSSARDKIPMPKGIRLFRRANGLRILRRWFSAKVFGLLFFCLFWDGFMVVWFSIAIKQRIWPMAAFGSIHGLVGVGLTYFTLAGFLNTTTITVINGLLQIRHAPMPVPGNRQIKADSLRQLYTNRIVHHGKNGTSISYELRAQTNDGRDEKVLGNLDSENQSLFIEQEIEEFLGIKDRAVLGEVER